MIINKIYCEHWLNMIIVASRRSKSSVSIVNNPLETHKYVTFSISICISFQSLSEWINVWDMKQKRKIIYNLGNKMLQGSCGNRIHSYFWLVSSLQYGITKYRLGCLWKKQGNQQMYECYHEDQTQIRAGSHFPDNQLTSPLWQICLVVKDNDIITFKWMSVVGNLCQWWTHTVVTFPSEISYCIVVFHFAMETLLYSNATLWHYLIAISELFSECCCLEQKNVHNFI